MTERLDDVECAVIALVDQLIRTTVRFAHDHIETADALPDIPSAETWRNIADAIDNPEAVRTRYIGWSPTHNPKFLNGSIERKNNSPFKVISSSVMKR